VTETIYGYSNKKVSGKGLVVRNPLESQGYFEWLWDCLREGNIQEGLKVTKIIESKKSILKGDT
jgi:hypothetical protein